MCRHNMQEQQSPIGRFDIPESTPVGQKVHIPRLRGRAKSTPKKVSPGVVSIRSAIAVPCLPVPDDYKRDYRIILINILLLPIGQLGKVATFS